MPRRRRRRRRAAAAVQFRSLRLPCPLQSAAGEGEQAVDEAEEAAADAQLAALRQQIAAAKHQGAPRGRQGGAHERAAGPPSTAAAGPTVSAGLEHYPLCMPHMPRAPAPPCLAAPRAGRKLKGDIEQYDAALAQYGGSLAGLQVRLAGWLNWRRQWRLRQLTPPANARHSCRLHTWLRCWQDALCSAPLPALPCRACRRCRARWPARRTRWRTTAACWRRRGCSWRRAAAIWRRYSSRRRSEAAKAHKRMVRGRRDGKLSIGVSVAAAAVPLPLPCCRRPAERPLLPPSLLQSWRQTGRCCGGRRR